MRWQRELRRGRNAGSKPGQVGTLFLRSALIFQLTAIVVSQTSPWAISATEIEPSDISAIFNRKHPSLCGD